MALNLDHVYGALLVGYSIGAVLFGVATTQLYIYHVNFPQDPLWMKLLAGFIWLMECGHQVSLSHIIYILFVTHFGDSSILTKAPLSIVAMNAFSIVIAFVVRGFYIYRVWTFSKSWILAVALLLTSLGGTAVFSWIVAVQNSLDGNFIVFGKQYSWLIVTATIVSACVEIVISLTMCTILFRERRASSMQSTMRAVDQLIIWTLETGLFTSGLMVAAAICAHTFKDSFVWIGIWFVAYRAYSNSFYAVLNGRTKLRSYYRGTQVSEFSSVVSGNQPFSPSTGGNQPFSSKFERADTELSNFRSDTKPIDIRVDVQRRQERV